jgi:hypothetical protein
VYIEKWFISDEWLFMTVPKQIFWYKEIRNLAFIVEMNATETN